MLYTLSLCSGVCQLLGFSDDTNSEEPTCQCRSASSIPGLGGSFGGGQGNPLKYSCPENPMDRGAWRATVHSVAESDMTEAIWQAHMSILTQ